jgi:putative peptidoglycan lipid II flippase
VTPVIATTVSIVINLAVKLALVIGLSFGAEGLALGTSAGAWINLAILAFVASARGLLKIEDRLLRGGPCIIGAALFATLIVWLIGAPLGDALTGVTVLRAEIYLVLLGLAALASYAVALIGLGWKR